MTGDMAEGNISANDQAILELLENDARLDARDLADILGEEAQEVQQAVRRMEEQKIICGYHTVINYNKVLRDERIMAFIEVEVSPMKGKGYDHTAALLAKYPEIDSLYLITGDNDFICLVQGKTMFEVCQLWPIASPSWRTCRARKRCSCSSSTNNPAYSPAPVGRTVPRTVWW